MDYLMEIESSGKQIQPSTLETIDVGFYEYIDDVLNLHVTSNDGFKKVPVVKMVFLGFIIFIKFNTSSKL